MSDFYDYINTPEQLPLPRKQPSAEAIVNSTANKIEKAKQALYDKIDVCCAQYGLYGLTIMDQAISQSLANMINGMNKPFQPIPQPRPATPVYQQQQNYQQVSESFQQPLTRDEAMVDSFMDNLGAIMESCDKDADLKAQTQLKQRMFEEKQYEMLAARAATSAPTDATIDTMLAKHADDFEEAE